VVCRDVALQGLVDRDRACRVVAASILRSEPAVAPIVNTKPLLTVFVRSSAPPLALEHGATERFAPSVDHSRGVHKEHYNDESRHDGERNFHVFSHRIHPSALVGDMEGRLRRRGRPSM
jgi:hypothetical protein